MGIFKTIVEEQVSAEIVEKKSKFIANLFFVESVSDAEEKIKSMKKKYYDAKHNCFAYIINENNEITKRSSDDGEPSGTAGAPMLEILEKNNIAILKIISIELINASQKILDGGILNLLNNHKTLFFDLATEK